MSRILVDQIRSNSASADAITLDGSGNLTIPGNATISGTATGFGGGKILQAVSATTTTVGIKAHDGTADCDIIVITHASQKHIQVMNAVVKLAQMQPKNGMTIMNDYLEDDGNIETFAINNLDTEILVTNVQYTAS